VSEESGGEVEYREMAQRIMADFVNYKRKVEERMGEEVAKGRADLVAELLPALDALELATGGGVEGVDLVHQEVLAVLTRCGLERIEVLGRESTVVVEHRGGYRWQGRLLRAAIVETETT
jgi:molecular chaperone GrpE